MGELLGGKNAVVTGAGRGIGRAIALALADEGANVVVNDLGGALDGTGGSNTPADEVVAEIKKKGARAIPSYDSVAEYESAGRIIKTCVDSFGSIDILVNTAGISKIGMCFETTPEDFDAVVKVHLYGTFYCSRHACVYMRKQKWGRIIGVSSTAALGTSGAASYAAAKGGITSLIISMALDLAGDGITCNCISPGAATRLTLSDEGKQRWIRLREEKKISEEEYQRIMGMPTPEFVAPMVVYLASDYGGSINGAILGTVGGKISIYSPGEEHQCVYKDWKRDGPWTIDEMKRVIPMTIEPFCRQLENLKPRRDNWG
jgi:NAD(P)-dependent dehydrogenase (short-subunit alcohol dehydrogenase family)